MATQRLTLATITGEAGRAVADQFQTWQSASTDNGSPKNTRCEIDGFCEALRANGAAPPVIYFCEWIDSWLMGDLMPGSRTVAGKQFEAASLSTAEAIRWAIQCGDQWPEQRWLAAKLQEAAEVGRPLAFPSVVLLRQVLGATVADEEVAGSLEGLPEWLKLGLPFHFLKRSTLNLVVIRVSDLAQARGFYEALGLRFSLEQHGSGPEHLAAELDGVVIEVYPRGNGAATVGVRLGFRVASVVATVAALQELGVKITSPPCKGLRGIRAVVVDPDGHRIEISEK